MASENITISIFKYCCTIAACVVLCIALLLGCEDGEIIADLSTVDRPDDDDEIPTDKSESDSNSATESDTDTGDPTSPGYTPSCGDFPSREVPNPITTQSEIASLVYVTHIIGDLTIQMGSDGEINDLNPLWSLRCVEGDLVIEGLDDLDPNTTKYPYILLPSLGWVDGKLKIVDNSSLPTCSAVWLFDGIQERRGWVEEVCIDGNGYDPRCPDYYTFHDEYQADCDSP